MINKDNLEIFNEYEIIMEHNKWRKLIPFIKFPKDWEIQITPPFFFAVVRFRVKYKKAIISIYLDCYDYLGFFGSPYWEIYPHIDNETFRCEMNDTESLLKAIQESIDDQNRC